MSYYLTLHDNAPVELGQGTFGTVSLVEDASGTLFANKTCTYSKHLKRTVDEADIMRQLVGCPFIVQLVDTIPNGEGVDIVMELCEGNLLEFLKSFPLGEDMVLDLISDVSNGLAFMSSKNMSHCDLKMENILYKSDETRPSGFRFLISDFGNVLYSMESFHYIQTRHYRAGENLMRSCDISSCDMASLACIIYEFITGEYLVQSSDPDEHLSEHLNAIGYDMILSYDLIPVHPLSIIAKYYYAYGQIGQKGFLTMDGFQNAMDGFRYKTEITEIIQRMLIPLPSLRLCAHQVNQLPLFKPATMLDEEPEDYILSLARACGVAPEYLFDDTINTICV
jgi:serine/threonine protein kinase